MELKNISKKSTIVSIVNAVSNSAAKTPVVQTLFKMKKGSKTTTATVINKSRAETSASYCDRGSQAGKQNTLGGSKAEAHILTGLHMPMYHTLKADDIEDLPDLENKDQLLSFKEKISEDLSEGTNVLEAKREQSCVEILFNGKIAGTEVNNLAETFKESQQKFTLKQKEIISGLNKIKSMSKKALSGQSPRGFMLLCGSDLYGKLINMKIISDKMHYLGDNVLKGFSDGYTFQGVHFVEVDGADANKAVLVPLVDQYFIYPTVAYGLEDIVPHGVPIAVSAAQQDHGEGVEFKLQANYVIHVERLNSLVVCDFEESQGNKGKQSTALVTQEIQGSI